MIAHMLWIFLGVRKRITGTYSSNASARSHPENVKPTGLSRAEELVIVRIAAFG